MQSRLKSQCILDVTRYNVLQDNELAMIEDCIVIK